MAGRVAILTPDPASEAARSRWPDVFARLAASLGAAGLAAESRAWTEPDLSGFDLVLPLLAWGYHQDGPGWRDAVARWEGGGIPLGNPGPVLRWNADKSYIGRLGGLGAPTVPTLYVDAVTPAAMDAAAARFGTDRLVAKPRVSASAWRTIRWSPGTPLDAGPPGAAMVQPYLPAIEQEGELSLFYFDKGFSHAIRKRPQPGDFRTQPEYNGIITPHAPSADELVAAEKVLAAVAEPLLYARVDLIRDEGGTPRLMELELVEPDLYLEHDPRDGAAFARAISGRTAQTAG